MRPGSFLSNRNGNLHSQDRTMRYWLLILFSSAVCGVTLWQLRFLNAGSITEPGPRSFLPKGAEPEIRRVEREVDEIEQQALAEWRALPINSSTRMDQVRILGKILLFDKNLSVNKYE